MTNPNVAIDITANDKTAKGIGSADKRFKKLGGDVEKAGSRGGAIGNIARTFGEVEQAAADAFGTKSVIGTIGKRVAAFRKVGSAMGSGLGRASVSLARVETAGTSAAGSLSTAATAAGEAEAGMGSAAEAAGGLAVAMGPVAIIGAAVVATLGAAAVAGYKFAAGWAAGTAQMGRFAETIGVASADLQKLQGAAERYGIGKDATNGAVSSFASTVHDARYGRNNDALALMMRLGVRFRTGKDGNLDYDAMLGDTADALARQKDPQAALMAANRLGIAPLLPMLRKGSANMRADETSFGRDGYVASGKDIANAQRFTRNAAILGQQADKLKEEAQAGTAGLYAPALEKAVAVGRDLASGNVGKVLGESATKLGEVVSSSLAPAADGLRRAANRMLDAAGSIASGLNPTGSPAFADAIRTRGERSAETAVSPKGARGSMQVMPYTAHHPGYGIRPAQNDSTNEYDRVGRDYANALLEQYGGDWALASAAYNAGPGAVNRWIKRFGDPRTGALTDAQFIADIPGHGRGSYEETRKYAERVTHAAPVKVEVTHVGAPAGTRTKVTHGTGAAPAVSYAMAPG